MFRTELQIKPAPWKIDHSHSVLSIGSCFAIHIGEKLLNYKFQSMTNPFGTIFNPMSVVGLLNRCLNGEPLPEWSFLYNQGLYRNYLLHSDISGIQKDQFEEKANYALKSTRVFLKKVDVLMLTFGTAIIYELKSNGNQVANCHKMPADIFEKRMLSVDEIVKVYDEFVNNLKAVNPTVKIIFTVSPVRHIKDTFELNNVSKSILRLAVEELTRRHDQALYFPSFELMMDDLRDYRFYADDMLHPNTLAINYIWDKFKQCFFDNETIDFIKKWGKIINAINHRPFHPDSEEHQSFLKKTLQQLEQFKHRVDVSQETEIIKNQLHDRS